MAESYLNRIIKTGDTPTPSGYVRLAGVPDGESIIANAPIIENGGVNYYPIYYMCLRDIVASESFTKTGDGVSSGADAYVFSDDTSTLYVGDTTHTFDVADDYTTSENWKCRYVIAYATEANKNDANGITINLDNSKTPFEFIGGQHLKLSSTSALFGGSYTTYKYNIKYINLSNSSFYNNEISCSEFCYRCYSLKTLLLPSLTTISGTKFCGLCSVLTALSLPSLTTISNWNFCNGCSSLTALSLPSLTTISNRDFCNGCSSLKTLSLPSLTDMDGNNFLIYCFSIEYFEIPSTITAITNTNTNTLNHTQFIKLPTDFDISACNFTGAVGHTKSIAWFTHLATQLKDNSGGTAKTMVLGAANIALIPTATATIISNKNWTLS